MDSFVCAGLLFSTVWLFKIRKVSDAVGIIAFQSALLAGVAVIMWYKTGIGHLLIAAGLTFTVKTIMVPAILYYTVRKTNARQEVGRTSSSHVSLLRAIVLSLAGYYAAAQLELPATVYGAYYLPISIMVILLGTFIMIEHKKVIMQAIGLIVIENGVFLITQAVSYGMPLIVELGVLFDLLVSAAVIAMLSLRMQDKFSSLNTGKMQNLKG